LYVPAPCKLLDEEIARNCMVGYVGGSCSPEERVEFENHYFSCDECSAKLAIIMSLRSPSSDGEEEKTLARLAVGSEAARIAWGASMKEATTSDSGNDLRKAA
jgi:anti-sigma factor RsiW